MKLPALKERSEHRYNLLPIFTAGFKAFKLLYFEVLHCYGFGKLIKLDNGMNSVILVVSGRLVINTEITLTWPIFGEADGTGFHGGRCEE